MFHGPAIPRPSVGQVPAGLGGRVRRLAAPVVRAAHGTRGRRFRTASPLGTTGTVPAGGPRARAPPGSTGYGSGRITSSMSASGSRTRRRSTRRSRADRRRPPGQWRHRSPGVVDRDRSGERAAGGVTVRGERAACGRPPAVAPDRSAGARRRSPRIARRSTSSRTRSSAPSGQGGRRDRRSAAADGSADTAVRCWTSHRSASETMRRSAGRNPLGYVMVSSSILVSLH